MELGKYGVLLVSRSPGEAKTLEPLRLLAAAINQRAGQVQVETAIARGNEPVVQSGIDRLVARGVQQIAILPVDLFDEAAGGEHHPHQDVVFHYPGVAASYGRPLGLHTRLIRAVSESLRRAEDGWPKRDDSRTAVLVIGRGSTDPMKNADLWKAARLIWEETGYGMVECAFARQTSPNPSDGVLRCLQLGARRVILLPYMLFPNSELKELSGLVDEWRAMVPYADFLLARPAGESVAPYLVDLFLEQAARVWEEQRRGQRQDPYKSAAAGL